MHRMILYGCIFISLVIFVSTAIGDAFDQTVNDIKALEAEFERNQTDILEKRQFVNEAIIAFEENHPWSSPQDEFESDAAYVERLEKLASFVAQKRMELEKQHLSVLLERRLTIQTQIADLSRRLFVTNDVTATLGKYDANTEDYPITFQAAEQSTTVILNLEPDNARQLKENWDEVEFTGWLAIDPGYQRGFIRIKLEYPPLWKDGLVIPLEVSPDRVAPWKENLSEAFSPDGRYHVRIDGWSDVLLAEVGSGDLVWKHYHTHAKEVTFSPDGKYIAVVAYYYESGGGVYIDRYLSIREMSSGNLVWRRWMVTLSSSFHGDGKYFATANLQDGVSIWEVNSGQLVREIPMENYQPVGVDFSPDGRYIATINRGGYIDIFRITDEEITFSTQITKEQSIRSDHSDYELGDYTARISWSADGLFISDGKKVYRTLLQPTVVELVAKPLNKRLDVNNDGVVDVDDLVLVAANFGKSFAADANPNPDVNRDGVVNLADIIEVVLSLQGIAGAPARDSQFTTEDFQRWIEEAKRRNNPDAAFQKGIDVLERLSAMLTETETIPERTSLLPNYPNPFNPETWIPYQLAAAADVTVRIYSANGTVVRTLELGHRSVGIYQNRTRAAYWDGRNAQGEQVASGIYFYTLTAGDFTATQKMLLMK